VNMLAKQHSWRKDFTRTGANTLGEQSQKIVGGLTQDVTAYYFQSLAEKDRGEDVLKRYSYLNKHFKFEFVDVDRYPTRAAAMGVKRKNAVILTLGNSQKKVSVTEPSEEQLKLYYESHKEAFMMPTSINLTEYSAKSEKAIQNFLRTGNPKGIKSHSATKKTKGMNPAMLSMLLSTPDGRFTKAINAGDKWVVFKVNGKQGKKLLPFEEARNAVAGRWRQEQQNKALKDYFSKMKTEANIKVIRK